MRFPEWKTWVLAGIILGYACTPSKSSLNLPKKNLEQEKLILNINHLLSLEETASHTRVLAEQIVALSRDYQLDPLLILAIIKTESGFRPQVYSKAGAIGLMQVRPIVIEAVGFEINISNRAELFDPYKNLHLGVHYFSFLLDKYHRNFEKALVAYNIGPTAVQQLLMADEELPLGYYQKVMHHYRAFKRKLLILTAPVDLT